MMTRFLLMSTTKVPSVQEDGIDIHDISFSNALGGRINAYLVIPPGNRPFPAIHFVHWLNLKAVNSNRLKFLPCAKELAQQGYLSILPDAFWSTSPAQF